jgi:hypothetical protein
MKVRNRPHWQKFSKDLQNYNGIVVVDDNKTLFSTRYKISYNDYFLYIIKYDSMFLPFSIDYGIHFEGPYMNEIDISKYVSGISAIYNKVHTIYKNKDKVDKKNQTLADLNYVEEKLFGIKKES